MKRTIMGGATLLALAACAPGGVIPSAQHFGAAVDKVDKSLRPGIETAAAADLAQGRKAALASGMSVIQPRESCEGFFMSQPGAHFDTCPAQLDIQDPTKTVETAYVVPQTPPMVAKVMLDVHSAFGAAIQTLASSTAPKDTADAVATFAKSSGDLATQLKAVEAQKLLGTFQRKMPQIQQITTALVAAQQAGSICKQMKRAKDAFQQSNLLLRIYVDDFVDHAPTLHHQAYATAYAARNWKLAAAEYAAWHAAEAKSPEVLLDQASAEFESTLAACGK